MVSSANRSPGPSWARPDASSSAPTARHRFGSPSLERRSPPRPADPRHHAPTASSSVARDPGCGTGQEGDRPAGEIPADTGALSWTDRITQQLDRSRPALPGEFGHHHGSSADRDPGRDRRPLRARSTDRLRADRPVTRCHRLGRACIRYQPGNASALAVSRSAWCHCVRHVPHATTGQPLRPAAAIGGRPTDTTSTARPVESVISHREPGGHSAVGMTRSSLLGWPTGRITCLTGS